MRSISKSVYEVYDARSFSIRLLPLVYTKVAIHALSTDIVANAEKI